MPFGVFRCANYQRYRSKYGAAVTPLSGLTYHSAHPKIFLSSKGYMTDDLYLEEEKLEEEARGLSILRFHKEHTKGTIDGTFPETFLGQHLLKAYVEPVADGIGRWLTKANTGKAGRRFLASKLLADVDPLLASFLTTKGVLSRVGIYVDGKPPTLTSLGVHCGSLVHDELRLREFERQHKSLSDHIHDDFNKRELPRYKREEYMRRAFERQDMEWNAWSTSDKLHVGLALLDVFKDITGDIVISTTGKPKRRRKVVTASLGLLQAVELASDHCEAMFTQSFPMVVPPLDWSAGNLRSGGYLTDNINPYPLVKGSTRSYRDKMRHLAEDGTISRTLDAVNAIQKTAWAINTDVLDVLEDIYRRNIPCGKLPRADRINPDPPPTSLENLPADHPEVKKYRAYCFRIHEQNRRVIGKRVLAQRAIHLAKKFSKYPAIYFPHDLDSRGRAYPRPTGLSTQGPDYVKGLLHFAEEKALGEAGVFWLGVHGANCFGEDKLFIHERHQWALDNTQLARRVAADPKTNTEWTRADSPVQFLAWCFEWAEAHQEGQSPQSYLSRLHVDLDATCSGLQHFSAMLRDETGGFHVNMTRSDERQDVYGAVASVATTLIESEPDTDKSGLASAWLKFGVGRDTTKRPVMVKPYSGTRTSCVQYVADSVEERIETGEPVPWSKEDMWSFKVYGADVVWRAIPQVIVAADEAMRWLSSIARLVARSKPDINRIEWTTPLGFPVYQSKFSTKSRRVETKFNGSIFTARLNEQTDTLDPRQMASSVPPSFVHSLDACHLQATISAASAEGLSSFAAVHDSFGVHACDVERFSRIIREQFVWMYEEHDVLREFLDGALPLIEEALRDDIPDLPKYGTLDLQGVLENEFFFS